MLLEWFNAREAVALGTGLADELVPRSTPAEGKRRPQGRPPALQQFLQRIDRDARPLGLNTYKRAQLANSFRWRLLENGVEQGLVDELTQMLVLRLTKGVGAAEPAEAAPTPPPSQSSARHDVETLVARGTELGTRHKLTEAVECFREALRLNPRHAIALDNLGVALFRLGHYAEAEEQLRRSIQIKPNYANAHRNLGAVLHTRGRTAAAETALRRGIKLNPSDAEGLVQLGACYLTSSNLAAARECFDKALKLAPRNTRALLGSGRCKAHEGAFEEAKALFERARELDPAMPGAWAAFTLLGKMSSADQAWVGQAEKIADGDINPVEESELRFAIGKYYDDVGQFARAFKNYQRANELHKLSADPYERDAHAHLVDEMMSVYTREALERGAAGASDSQKPVFVVGMPRSGTTLIEQIIASHPAVTAAGELPFWTEVMRKHDATLRHELPSEQLRAKLAADYLRTLGVYSSDALRVVDKAPVNSDYLGIIRTVFPRARMIYVRRDPIDTCLSCYFQQLTGGLSYTMDLEDLAHYYREHWRLMAHWRAVLPPGTLLEVPYAELVADQETWTRRMLEFLGLEWDARCLEFQQTKRAVMTSSYWQVRQKIYRGSVGRWQNYRKFIGPLLALKDLDP
jgi:tetratricopeptide (TPR) repeat protein